MQNDYLCDIVRGEFANDAEIISSTARPKNREFAFQFVRMQVGAPRGLSRVIRAFWRYSLRSLDVISTGILDRGGMPGVCRI